jgi:hypothetical protein
MGVFGFECTLDRVIEELKSYNDFSIHRVIILDPVNASFYFVMYLKIWWTIFYIIARFFFSMVVIWILCCLSMLELLVPLIFYMIYL